jgi:anti-sigma B factor antagonist
MDHDAFALELIHHRERTILVLYGEVDLAAVPEIEAAFSAAFAQSPQALEVDLGEVTFFGSEGIRRMIEAMQAAQGEQIPFRISEASAIVKRALEVSGLERMIDNA